MRVRCDSWASVLTEEQAWRLYDKSRTAKWYDCCEWAAREFNLPRKPGKTAFNDWRAAMQKQEHSHTVAQMIVAQNEAREIAKKYNVTDEDQIRQLMSGATDAAVLAKDPQLARELYEIAMGIKQRQQEDRKIEIEERKLAVKEEDLKLAREKFEFDATKKAMEKAAEIKGVSEDDTLDEDEKIRKVREALFGFARQ